MPRGGSANEPSPVNIHVGARLRQRRIQLGLSQTAVGRKLGLTFQQIQKYERGVNALAANRLAQLAHALDVPISYFFEGLAGSGGGRAAPEKPLHPGEIRFIEELRRLPSPVRAAMHQLVLSTRWAQAEPAASSDGGEIAPRQAKAPAGRVK